VLGVESAPTNPSIEIRLKNINNYFTLLLYENVCRSLFEKHKLLFSLMLCQRILASRNEIDPQEWRYFLAGPTGEIKIVPNPTSWIAANSWPEIYR